MRISDWSSDVCSSDLERERQRGEGEYPRQHAAARPCPDAGIGLAHLTRITGHVVPLLPERHVSDPARWIAACRTAGRMPQTVDPRQALARPRCRAILHRRHRRPGRSSRQAQRRPGRSPPPPPEPPNRPPPERQREDNGRPPPPTARRPPPRPPAPPRSPPHPWVDQSP